MNTRHDTVLRTFSTLHRGQPSQQGRFSAFATARHSPALHTPRTLDARRRHELKHMAADAPPGPLPPAGGGAGHKGGRAADRGELRARGASGRAQLRCGLRWGGLAPPGNAKDAAVSSPGKPLVQGQPCGCRPDFPAHQLLRTGSAAHSPRIFPSPRAMRRARRALRLPSLCTRRPWTGGPRGSASCSPQ